MSKKYSIYDKSKYFHLKTNEHNLFKSVQLSLDLNIPNVGELTWDSESLFQIYTTLYAKKFEHIRLL